MGIYRTVVETRYPGGGSPGFNTWLFRTGPQDGDPSIGDGALREFYGNIRTLMPSSVTVAYSGDWTKVSGDGDPYYDFAAASLQGDNSNGLLPPFVCAGLVHVLDGLPSKRYGRTFLGPLSRSVAGSDGNVDPGAREDIVGWAEDSLLIGGTGGGQFAVFSRSDNLYRDITGYRVPSEFWSLTSRRD